MEIESTIKLKVSECGKPIRVILADGTTINIIVTDDRKSAERVRMRYSRKLKRKLPPPKEARPQQRAVRKKLNTTARAYRCEPCNLNFPIKQALGSHNRYHHPKNGKRRTRGWMPNGAEGKKEYRCGPCDLTFDTLLSLYDHQEKKHGVKQIVGNNG